MKKNYIKNKIQLFSALVVLSALFFGCEADEFQKVENRNWQLTWSDEFDGVEGELPNPEFWNFDLGNGEGGWGNAELQNYTNSPQNIAIDSVGNLVITAIQDGSYTSARINTKGLFEQQYGRFEARLKTPFGPGLWPAFWLIGANIDEVSWPQCGEIDIMELRGQQPHIINGTLHGPGYSGGNPISKSYALYNQRFDTEFHIFAIEWDENKIDFFVDDFLYHRVEKQDVPGEWVYDQPFFIILNVAVGGNYVGFPTTGTPFPQKMIIDYVRVYKEI